MDYVGLLTRGVPTAPNGMLPFADFPIAWRGVVLAACREAWRRLSSAAAAQGISLASFSEDDITGRLKTVLNELRKADPSPVPGFSSALFETVVRDAVVTTFDGSSLDKKPDLVFRPIDTAPGLWLSEYRGLFTECKIVDGGNHSIGLYCSKGVRRFVSGEYAWAMPSGLMIAYVRDGKTIGRTLRSALKRARRTGNDIFYTKRLPRLESALGSAPVAYLSVHRREWIHTNGEKPGDVEIVHLWLS